MNNQNKTPDELRQEMIKQLQESGNAQFLGEVAMPGVLIPVPEQK